MPDKIFAKEDSFVQDVLLPVYTPSGTLSVATHTYINITSRMCMCDV